MLTISVEAPRKPGQSAPCALVVTTLNERDNIRRLLRSISRQSRIPSELIIVDAGSVDGTLNIIDDEMRPGSGLNLKTYREHGTIGHCRNFGIAKTHYDWIISTDGDCELDFNFVQAMCSSLEGHDVVGGAYHVEPQTFAERLFQARQSIPWDAVDDLYVYPSMAIGFRKSAYEAVGGYDETLEASEDLDLCLKLRRTPGLSLCLNKDAKLKHYVGREFWTLVRISFRDMERNVAYGLVGRGTPHWKILLASALPPIVAFAVLTGAAWVLVGIALVVASYSIVTYVKVNRAVRARGFGFLVVLTDLLTRGVQILGVYGGVAAWFRRRVIRGRLKPRRKLG